MRQEDMDGADINLVECCLVAWRRRWQIVIPACALAVIAGIVSAFMAKTWEVQAIFAPGTFLLRSAADEERLFAPTNSKALATAIARRTYHSRLAAELGVETGEIPEFKAEALRDTHLVVVSLRTRDPERGKRLLAALFEHVRSDDDRMIESEAKRIEADLELRSSAIVRQESDIRILQESIKREKIALAAKDLDREALLIDQALIRHGIQSVQNQLALNELRQAEIQQEIAVNRERAARLDEQQLQLLAERHQAESQSIALLLYANEVQSNLQYANALADRFGAQRLRHEELTAKAQALVEDLRKLDNQLARIESDKAVLGSEIESMNIGVEKAREEIAGKRIEAGLVADRRNRIEHAAIAKPATVSSHPVFPTRTRNNVVLAGLVGMVLALIVAFLRENLAQCRPPTE